MVLKEKFKKEQPALCVLKTSREREKELPGGSSTR